MRSSNWLLLGGGLADADVTVAMHEWKEINLSLFLRVDLHNFRTDAEQQIEDAHKVLWGSVILIVGKVSSAIA